jgi:flagellar biosynthesis protein FliP
VAVNTVRQIWSKHWKAAAVAAFLCMSLLTIPAMALASPAPAPAAPHAIPAAAAAPDATATPAPTASPTGEPGATATSIPLINLPTDRASSVQILMMLTVLSLAPSLLIMLTGFTRIIIVLSFVRNAIGVQQMPSNQVLIGLALFLTFFVMSPVIDEINKKAYTPYINGTITQDQALTNAMVPLRAFMLRQTYDKDLTLFASMAKITSVKNVDEIPTNVVIPAFITSEIKRAFEIGFIIFIPFIVIDMIVSSTLMSMGMMMLPPTAISLPFKILLFVLVDGWTLTIKTLVLGFK